MSALDPVAVGWREWVAFPELGLPAVRAKVDTGASTSALHATRIKTVERDGALWARFTVQPFFRRTTKVRVACEAPVVDRRLIRSSNGHEAERLVVLARMRFGVRAGSPEADVEVTLTDRRQMRFPMLLGREAMAGRVVVHPGASFLLGRVEHVADLYADAG